MHQMTRTIWSLATLWTVLATAIENDKYAGKHWRQLPAIASGPRQEHSVVASDNAIWVLGGTFPNAAGETETTDRVEYYSLSDGTWHSAAPMLQPLNHLNAAVVNNDIYVLGGLAGDGAWLAQNINMVYSPSSNTWQLRSPFPPNAVRGACAVGVYGSKIYLAGGMTYLGDTQDALMDVTSYDVSSDTWDTDLPPLPQPRQHVAGAVVGSTFYILGGREDGQRKIQDSVYALDLDASEGGWREMVRMPTARGGLACAAIEQKIFCFGGEGNANNEPGVFEQVEVYDTVRDEWTRLEDMPVPRHGGGVAAADGKIYVPGGSVLAGTAPTDVFDEFAP